MARPRKSGLDYFPLDVDFFSDEKIIVASGKFGIVAEVAALRLLCCIYRRGYFIEWNEPLKYKLLRDLPGTDATTLEAIVDELARWGFFDAELLRSQGILTSEGIQRRYFEAVRRCKPAADLPHLLVQPAPKVSAAKTPVNVTETPERKEKETKENKTKQKETTTTTTTVAEVEAEEFSMNNFSARFLKSLSAEQTQAMLQGFGFDMAGLQQLTDSIVAEWTMSGVKHTSFDDARTHMLNHMRRKYRARDTQRPQDRPTAAELSTLEQGRRSWQARRDAERAADAERRRQYLAEREATGMSGWQAYCKQQGLAPGTSPAEYLAARYAC